VIWISFTKDYEMTTTVILFFVFLFFRGRKTLENVIEKALESGEV